MFLVRFKLNNMQGQSRKVTNEFECSESFENYTKKKLWFIGGKIQNCENFLSIF